jgi:HEAT repeat-containing taxis protein
MGLRGEFSRASFRVDRLERERNVAGLTQALDEGGVRDARVNAAMALGQLGDLRAIPHLLEFFNDPDPQVRWGAVYALRLLKATEARQLFETALTDEAPLVRMEAARALGWIHAVDSLSALRQALGADPDQEVRMYAVESLVVLGDKATREGLPEILNAMPRRIRRGGR